MEDAIQLADACAVTKQGYWFCWGGRYGVPWGTVEVMRVSPWRSETQ